MDRSETHDLVLHFTDIYRHMGYLGKKNFTHVFLQDVEGTNLYIDGEAEKEILRRLKPLPPCGIHLLDNGNFHYATRLFLSMLEEPFDLLVLDHHRDDQEPAFAGMRSCGSWIRDSLEDMKERLVSLTLVLSRDRIERRGTRYNISTRELPDRRLAPVEHN